MEEWSEEPWVMEEELNEESTEKAVVWHMAARGMEREWNRVVEGKERVLNPDLKEQVEELKKESLVVEASG